MEGEGFYLSEILDEDMPTAMKALAFGSSSSSDDSGFEVEEEEDDEGSDQDEEMMPAPSEASATAIASSTASASTPSSSGDDALQVFLSFLLPLLSSSSPGSLSITNYPCNYVNFV